MPRQHTLFSGFVEMVDGSGLKRVDIYRADDGYIYAYVDENLADDVATGKEFADFYGTDLWYSANDFKENRDPIDISEVWPDDVSSDGDYIKSLGDPA